MARIEDIRGNSSNLISALDRGELGWGEKRALQMQRRNRADENMTPGEVAERNLRSIAVDRALKTARFHGPAR